MLNRFLAILLFGLCLAETRFYYPQDNITKINFSSDVLIAIDNNQDFEYFKNEQRKIEKEALYNYRHFGE